MLHQQQDNLKSFAQLILDVDYTFNCIKYFVCVNLKKLITCVNVDSPTCNRERQKFYLLNDSVFLTLFMIVK